MRILDDIQFPSYSPIESIGTDDDPIKPLNWSQGSKTIHVLVVSLVALFTVSLYPN